MAKIYCKIRACFGLAATAVALTGCPTYFNAVRIAEGVKVPPAGAPYNLSFTQYDVTVTRRVADCWFSDENQVKKDMLVIATDAAITRKEVRDPARNYVIDLDSLQAGWKITNVEVAWHDNGTLKSINAAAEDRVGPILVSAATTLGKLVALAVAGGAVDSKVVSKEGGCEPETLATLESVKTMKASIKSKTSELSKLTRELENMTTIATSMGKAWGKAERKQFADQLRAVYAAKEALVAEEQIMSDSLDSISDVTKFTWPPNGTTFETKSNESLVADIPFDVIRKWGHPVNPIATQIATRVFARIEPTSPISTTATCEKECAEDKINGLKYRMPATGKLLICSTAACNEKNKEIIAVDSGLISQLGPVFTLPLRSGVFTNKTLAATFNEAGQPTTIGVKAATASAETAATSISTLADAFITTRGKVIPSRLDRLKAETELLKAQSELDTAKKSLLPPANEEATIATAAFSSDTALLDARLANLKAQEALDAASIATAI